MSALRLAMIKVSEEAMRSVGLKRFEGLREGKKRIRRNTPAVTKVDEWTRADTGVGAAMAAGSQLEKGICALLVMAARIIVRVMGVVLGALVINQCPWLAVQPMASNSAASPMRLVRAVTRPAARDLGFW